MSVGSLTEGEVEGIRTGALPDPTMGQVSAQAAVFGVEPSYLLDRGEPPLDGELVEAVRDGTVREAVREISRLPERETADAGNNASVRGTGRGRRLTMQARKLKTVYAHVRLRAAGVNQVLPEKPVG
jgi:hypothetical protein